MKTALFVIAFLLMLSTAIAAPFPDPSLFQEPNQTPGLGIDAWHASLTPDGQHMVFTSGFPHRIYSADWLDVEQRWGNIQLLELGGGSWQSTASITLDGQWLFFTGSEGGGGNIYRSQRLPDGTWSPGVLVPLGQTVVGRPFFDAVRSRLYFTIDTGFYDFDLAWVSYDISSNSVFGPMNPLTSVNTTDSEDSARVFGDGSILIFNRNLKFVSGTSDIWMVTWNINTGDWNPPFQLAWPINTLDNDEGHAWYCEVCGTLYFTYVEAPFAPHTAQIWESHIVQNVGIDIKPGSFPNSINLSSAGVVPIAILSTQDFNAPENVNPDTITLAGAKVKIVGKSGKYLCHDEDVNSDGLSDLVCQVETVQFLIEPGDSTAVLEGNTYDGIPIRGEDSIRIVP